MRKHRLLAVVATLLLSPAFAQPQRKQTLKDPPLAIKQSLAPDASLAGDVKRKARPGAPGPSLTASQFTQQVELQIHEKRLVQIELLKELLAQDPSAAEAR